MNDPKGMSAVMEWLSRGLWSIIDTALGFALGIGEAAFLRLYQHVIEPSPPGSLPVRLFTWAANKPLRMMMLQFFCASGDFTRRLVDYTANSKFASPTSGPTTKGVSSNLGLVTRSLKREFGLKFIYCWHGLPGYWGGVSPESPVMKRLKPRVMPANPTPGVLEIEPSMAWGPGALGGIGIPEDAEELYQMMHSYLASQGVDGVKVDCQAGIGLLPCSEGTPSKSAKYHYALEDSVKRHFPGNHIINCMCHDSLNFYRFVDSAVARACDDFYPRDKASHKTHIANSAYNSLFLSALVQPDWDMFQSEHPANVLHAAARAVSGAAIYVSDKPGNHNFDLLKRLVLPDGTVLRANLPGRPTVDSVFRDVMRDGKSLLKVWNRNNCSGIVGVFNVQGSSWDRQLRRFQLHDPQPPRLTATVLPRDAGHSASEGRLRSPEGRSVVAHCSISGSTYTAAEAAEGVPVSLGSGGAEIVTFAEQYQRDGVEFAPVGLTGMLNPGGAVVGVRSMSQGGRVHFSVTFRGCGAFTAVASRGPQCVHLVTGGDGGGIEEIELAARAGPKGVVVVDVPQLPAMRGELLFSFGVDQ